PVLTDPVGAFSHYADGQASNSASRLRRSRRSDGCGRSVRREQARAGARAVDGGFVDEPARVQTVVKAALCEELGMRAFLDDATAIEYEDAVSALHRRKPVRDDDRRAPAHEPIESLLHEELALVVERAGRFVEQEDARVAQE